MVIRNPFSCYIRINKSNLALGTGENKDSLTDKQAILKDGI